MYKATKVENLKVRGLNNQMDQVKDEFDELMRLRDEARRILEDYGDASPRAGAPPSLQALYTLQSF